VSKDAALNKKY